MHTQPEHILAIMFSLNILADTLATEIKPHNEWFRVLGANQASKRDNVAAQNIALQ